MLGGLLVETLSWPWIFFVNVPVGIAAFVVSLRYVPESKDEHVHKSFDLAGAVTVTGGLIALVYGIVRSAESGWGSGEVLGILALSAVLLVGFVLIERRSAEPLVRLSIFSVRTVRGANAAMFVVAAGLFAMFFFNTLYVQRVLGFSPLEAGFAFVPFTAGIIIGAGLSQKLVPALGAREVPLIGSALGAVGLLTLPEADPGLVVRHRPAPRHPADVGRDGARVRADHAHRDERRPRSTTPDLRRASSTRRSRSAVRSGSRSCRRSRRTGPRTSSPRSAVGRPRPRRRRRSSSGFHVTWLASAILLAAGRSPAARAAPPPRRRRGRAGRGRSGRRLGGAPLDDVVERAAEARGERAGQDGRLAERGHLDARGVRDPPLEPRAHGLEQEVAVRAEAAAEDDERDVGDGGDGDDVERDPARDLVDDLAPRARRPRAPRRRCRARRTAA